MRVVFDTTILASLPLATRDPLAYLHMAVEQRAFDLYLSDYILDELRRAFHKPYFAARLPDQGRAFLALLQQVATVATPTTEIIGVVRDPNDDPILSLAVSVQAEYLVSGDKAVLAVGSYEEIKVVSARAFFDLLRP